jgi:hypothetical protein
MIIGSVTTIVAGKIEAVHPRGTRAGNARRIIAGMPRAASDDAHIHLQAVLDGARTGLTDMAAFIAISMLLGFNYGSCLSVFPSAVKDNFGLKNFGVNYGLVFTWGGGSVFRLSRSL